MTEEDVLAWGAANNITPDKPHYLREQFAWREILCRLPPGWCTRGIYWKDTCAQCFVIGSNVTKEDLACAADIELIDKYHSVLRTKDPPGWFKLYR